MLKLMIFWMFSLSVLASELSREEVRLKDAYLSIRQQFHSPFELSQKLHSKTDNDFIRKWYQAEVQFQKDYDSFQLKKQEYFANKEASIAACFYQSLNTTQKLKLKKIFLDLHKKKKNYEELRVLFGTENDLLRAMAYRKMTDAHLAYSKKFEKVLGLSKITRQEKKEELNQNLKLIPHIFKIQSAMMFKRHSAQGETPILDTMGAGILAFAQMEKIEPTLHGLENLPAPFYDGKTINVVTFEHAHGILDTIIQSVIPKEDREGLGFFGAAQYVFPKPWARSLEKSDHYIVVNKGKEIARTRELIDARKLHGFMAAAEGFTSTGLFETRPISPLFVDTFWELQELGYEINLYPMSYPENHQLYHELPEERPLRVKGIVGKPLSSEAARHLRKITGDKDSVGIWLRSAWHWEHTTNEDLFLSAPSIDELESSLHQRLWGKIKKAVSKNCL